MQTLDISERAKQLLKALTERYIREGQPVGSRTLSRDTALSLSPATIRNVMADLEDLGFVASPHTSAGRVPTVSGYRMFVDSLLSLKPIDKALLQEVQQQLDIHDPPAGLVDSASRLLSSLTHLAGVVMVPKHNQIAVKQIAEHYDVNLIPVPGKGAADALKSALGGHVDATTQGSQHVQQIKAGKMKQIASLIGAKPTRE